MYAISVYKQSFKPQVMIKLLRKRYASSGKGRGWRMKKGVRGGRGTPLSGIKEAQN